VEGNEKINEKYNFNITFVEKSSRIVGRKKILLETTEKALKYSEGLSLSSVKTFGFVDFLSIS
jgi:hypothetical protein